MNVYERALTGLMDENEFMYFPTDVRCAVNTLSGSSKKVLYDTAESLGATHADKLSHLFIDRKVIDLGGKHLIVDEAIHFNRYRALTFRHPVYSTEKMTWRLEDYKRFCRKYESEAMKAGLKAGVWSNTESDAIFGAAAETGDFFGNGATGWKLLALRDTLMDLYYLDQGMSLIRYPMYSSIMIKGKLENYGKLLLYGTPENKSLCFKLLHRVISTYTD